MMVDGLCRQLRSVCTTSMPALGVKDLANVVNWGMQASDRPKNMQTVGCPRMASLGFDNNLTNKKKS